MRSPTPAWPLGWLSMVGYITHHCNASAPFEARHLGLGAEVLSDATGSVPHANTAGRATAEEIHRIFSVVFESNSASVLAIEAWVPAVQAGQALPRSDVTTGYVQARQGERTQAG